MTAPNMATLTASLERSLRNCSLNHSPATAAAGFPRSGSSSHAPDAVDHTLPGHRFQPCLDLSSSSPSSTSETTAMTLVDLDSHISLPYHWEQCLDLETGEIYYRNWRNGMKATEDPRLISKTGCSDLYSTEEDDNDADNEEDEDDDNESYDGSEGSSTTEQYSSPQFTSHRGVEMRMNNNNNHDAEEEEDVLVVAGCKSCLMYYMVPKNVLDCPKCTGQLLHFDRSENTASN